MKKNLIILFSIAFVCNVTAQKPEYLVSNDVNGESARFLHATADNEHYFVIRMEKESKKVNVGYFDIYNKESMKREISQPLNLPAKEPTQMTIRELKALGDYIFVFYDYISQMDEMNHSAVLLLDKTGKTDGNSIELNVAKDRMKRFVNQRGEEYIESGIHRDGAGNYIMVSLLSISAIGKQMIFTVPEVNIRIFNGTGKMISEKKLPIEICASQLISQETDENGNLYLLFNGLTGKEGSDYHTYGYEAATKKYYHKTVAVFNSESWNLKLYHPANDGEKLKFKILESRLYKSADGRVLLAGLYVNDDECCDPRGIYAGWFDKDGTFKGDHIDPWTVSSENKAKKNIRLVFYSLKAVHLCKDNSIKYLLSKNYIEEYSEMRSGVFLEATVSPSLVLSMKYGMHGTNIDKDFTDYAFPTELCTDEDSYFFYNDQEKNLSKEMSDSYSKLSNSEMRESVKPCYSHFPKNGSVENKVFISDVKGESNVLIQSSNALKINDSELLVPVMIGGRNHLMKITMSQ